MISMAKALKPMLDRFVFVGGCAVDYLIDDSAVTSTRVTGDVDVIAEIATKHEYYSVVDELKSLGFAEFMPMFLDFPIRGIFLQFKIQIQLSWRRVLLSALCPLHILLPQN